MGKAGKERKKRKLDALDAALDLDELEDGSEGAVPSEKDIASATLVLDAFHWDPASRESYFSKSNKALRTAVFPLIEAQLKARAHHELIAPLAKLGRPIEDADVSLVRRVAQHLSTDEGKALFASANCRSFRRALHPFVLQQHQLQQSSVPGSSTGSGASAVGSAATGAAAAAAAAAAAGAAMLDGDDERSFSSRISNALRARDWARALALLHAMGTGTSGEVLRLGALQRWVRDCDLANTDVAGESGGEGSGENDAVSAKAAVVTKSRNTALLLLDAVMRVGETCVSPPAQRKGAAASARAVVDLFGAVPSLQTTCVVHRHPPFSAPSSDLPPAPASAPAPEPEEPPVFHVVHAVPGAERKPPSAFPLHVYSTAPGTIRLAADDDDDDDEPPSASLLQHRRRRRRLDVPGVPGAFVMTDVLSSAECARIVAVAETIGYRPDAVDDIDNIVWLADESLWGPIFRRCEPMLPPRVGACELRGINARFRLFRYYPGAVYRPHIDGAWSGSGLVDGKYTDDAFSDGRYSKLTFLIYLNDVGGAGGGATTFFLPSHECGFGHIEARSVQPRQGHVLCFPHGDALGSLVHEGSEVQPGGVKYIIRTDVLYSAEA